VQQGGGALRLDCRRRRGYPSASCVFNRRVGLRSVAIETVPIIEDIGELGGQRSAWFVDIWGVMHNGVQPFEEAVAACQTFRSAGGLVVLVSNSPRTRSGVIAQLCDIGVPVDAYDAVVTSGDATRDLIGKAVAEGRSVFHLGPERDRPLFNGIEVDFADAENCDVVVCTGLFDDTSEGPDDYTQMLSALAARGVEMICANPDLQVERGGKIIFCAGALAESYGEVGGEVSLAGKPHAPIYDLAFEVLRNVADRSLSKSRVLAIGDGVKTDIAGACRAGVEAVYIASGVHLGSAKLDATALTRLFPESAERPIAAMTGLRFAG